MAILDERCEFADNVDIAAAAGTALIGDQIDIEVLRDMGSHGQPVFLVISVDTEVITGGTAGVVRFVLASDATAAIATDGTATEHFTSHDFITDDAAVNAAQLSAGSFPVVVSLPIEGVPYERYLGILVVTTTTTTTDGNISAYLTLSPPTTRKVYDDATN